MVALTAAVSGLLRHDGPWANAIVRHTAAVEAARCLGDQLSQANALSDLAETRKLAGDHPAAAQAHLEAFGIYRDLDDRLGQAHTLLSLGTLRMVTGDYPAAARAHEVALVLYRELSDRLGQARTMAGLSATGAVRPRY